MLRHILLSLLCTACAPPAMAQLAPPPPSRAEAPPVIYPPPPPPPKEERDIGVKPRPRPAPQFAFQPLAEFGPDGKLKPLGDSPEYLALAHNPKLKPAQRAKLLAGLEEHYAAADKLVIDNIDLVLDVANGAFDDANLNNPQQFNQVQGITAVLMTARGLPERLERKDAIDIEQMNASMTIYRDWVEKYNKAAMDEAIAKHGAQNKQAVGIEMGRAMFRLMSMEAMLAFRRIALHIAADFDAVAAQAGLDAQWPEPAQQARRAIAAARDDDAKYQAVISLLTQLPFARQQRMLEVGLARAPARDFAELKAALGG